MLDLIGSIPEFLHIVFRRIRQQGIVTTFKWFHAVGTPWLTGRLSLRYSKISPHLYIGPQYGLAGKAVLEKAGVGASMSLRAEYNDQEYDLAFPSYSYLPIEDNTPPTIEQLDTGVAFIKEVIADEKTVYVHCGSGVGRAPTMVAAYLMADEGLSVEEAVTKIKKVRPFIRILPDQIERLYEYREHLKQAV